MCTKERGKERSPRPSFSPFSHFLQHHGSQCATLETGSADSPHAHRLRTLGSKYPAVLFQVKQKTEITNKTEDSHNVRYSTIITAFTLAALIEQNQNPESRYESLRPIFIHSCFIYVIKHFTISEICSRILLLYANYNLKWIIFITIRKRSWWKTRRKD